MKASSILNPLRKFLFANKTADGFLSKLTSKYPGSLLFIKLLPGNNLYDQPALRHCKKWGINFDISDYQNWLIYFNSSADSSFGVLKFLQEGNIVFDIGGNIGQTALRMAEIVGDKGKVYTFEPYPSNFNKLKTNLLLNPQLQNITAENVALGESKAELESMLIVLQIQALTGF